MTRTNILEAITPSRVGGAEVYVSAVCQRLPSMDVHVDLFCPEGRPFIAYAAERGISSVSWKTYGKLDPLTIVRLALLIRRRHVGVIHTHLSTASILGALAGKLARRPSVAHVHGLNTATTYKYSNAVIAVSGAVKDHLLAQGLEESRIRVLHNAVDPSAFQPVPIEQAKASAGFGADTDVLGVFGRLSPEKGQRDALQAMRIIGKSHPRARLVFAGAGRDQQELAAATVASGLAGMVTFIGFLSDVRPLMSACDVVIVPSLREGFGLTAVEAMALGRPVVASDVGGLKEIVVEGETGILVPPGKPGLLAEAVSRLLDDRPLAESLGGQGRQRVLESFNLDRHMQELVEILASPGG